MNGHTNVMATWAQGTAQPGQADMMASFSSRGPTGDWIKPDVTAPGVQVLAGMTPQPDQTTADNGPPGNLYQAIAGTSMSSPHSAGASALVKAAHPTWTPAEIKSALMTSSVQGVVKEDGVTPAGVFDMGAGRVQVDRAVNPTLVFNETYANMVAAGSDTLHRTDLNIASIDATTMSGSITTHRTAINVSGKRQTLDVQITQPAGVTITVGNNNHALKIAKGGSLTFPITIDAPSVASGQYQGRINLVPRNGSNRVTIPVAFVKKQGAVTLTNSCSPLSFAARTGASHCTVSAANLSPQSANVALNVAGPKGKKLQYENVGLPGSVVGAGEGVQWSGTLSPAIPPQVTGVTPGSSPAGGYLPLSAFGITPIAGVGDDTITNFNVPTFFYGAEPYTSVGVVSNGYLVLGGGTSADIVFTPQHFPNAARPNNVLAPLWSDLNPTASPGAGSSHRNADGRVADVARGGLAEDQELRQRHDPLVRDLDPARQRLCRHGPASEDVSWTYGTGADAGNAGTGDPDSGVNWGAENRDGTSGANIATAPADGSQYQVHTTPPTAGGSVSIPYDITSKKPGSWNSVASMTSNRTPGITQVVTTLTVTP